MASTIVQPKIKRIKARSAVRQKPFWAGKPNSELDRAGSWLLENLSAVRVQAISRGHPR